MPSQPGKRCKTHRRELSRLILYAGRTGAGRKNGHSTLTTHHDTAPAGRTRSSAERRSTATGGFPMPAKPPKEMVVFEEAVPGDPVIWGTSSSSSSWTSSRSRWARVTLRQYAVRAFAKASRSFCPRSGGPLRATDCDLATSVGRSGRSAQREGVPDRAHRLGRAGRGRTLSTAATRLSPSPAHCYYSCRHLQTLRLSQNVASGTVVTHIGRSDGAERRRTPSRSSRSRLR
jgi:hypothetical protein